jgi:hypothetical protein
MLESTKTKIDKIYSVVFKSSYVFSGITIDANSSARFIIDPKTGFTLTGSDYVINYIEFIDKQITVTINIQSGNSFEMKLALIADDELTELKGIIHIGAPDVNGNGELRINQEILKWSDKPNTTPGPIKGIPFVVKLAR